MVASKLYTFYTLRETEQREMQVQRKLEDGVIRLTPASSSSDDDDVFEITRSKGDVPPAHYTLKIKSFSQLTKIVRKTDLGNYESGDFEAGGYKWKLLMYPDGNAKRNGNDHISLYLALADTSAISHGRQIDVTLKFFVYDQIRDKYLTIQDERIKRYHGLRTDHGFHKLLPLTMFNDLHNGYLVDDRCAFGAEVHVIKCKGKGEKISIIKDPQTGSYIWVLKEFSTFGSTCQHSELFTAANYKWQLDLYPKGDSREKDRSLSLYLTLANSHALLGQKVYVEYTISVKSQVSGSHQEGKVSGWFSSLNTSRGYSSFMFLSDLHNAARGFLVKDILVIEAKITLAAAVKGLS